MSRQRALFVATPATGTVVAGLESSARNRGHNAISVLDAKHASPLAKAFRPSVIVLVAPPGESGRLIAAFGKDLNLRAVPLVVLASSQEPALIVECFACGAAAVEPLDGGVPALERALDVVSTQAGWSPVERAVDALVKRRVHGSIRLTTPVDGIIRLKDGAVESARCGPDTDMAALARLRDATDAAFVFEAPEEMMIVEDSEVLPIEEGMPEAEMKARLGPVRVLVVEDDPELARMYQRVLEHEGFVVTTAGDGIAGFAAAVGIVPDLIVTDIAMPRADGWELLGRVRDDARVREIPVVMVSNFTEMLGQLEGLRVGADAYLEKAGPKAELVEVVRTLAERRRAARVIAASRATPCGGRLEDIGPAALLSALEEGERTGELIVAAGWGTVSVALERGILLGARAELDDVVLTGTEALLLLLDLGETSWRLVEAVPVYEGGPNARFSTMKNDLSATLNARRAATTVAAATRRGLTIVEERARVYVGTAEEARAVVDRMHAGEHIDERTKAAFRDLVRRGVAR